MADPVLRNSQSPEFNVADNREARQSSIGGPGASRGADVVSDSSGAHSGFLRALDRLTGTVSGGLQKLDDQWYKNRYLAGQAKAGVIKGEEEIQGDPLTRDWEVAGYRDAMGKLALADQKAQFKQDLPKIRAMSADQFEAYMAARRHDMMPGFNGMTLEQRAVMASQMEMEDSTDTRTWTTEHTKYIIEQKSAAVATLWNTALQGIHTAQIQHSAGDLGDQAFDAQIQSTMGNLVGAVWLDPSLPRDVQANLTKEAFEMALANDSTELYEAMARTVMDDPQGGRSTLLARLPAKEQDGLADKFRQAKERARDRQSLAYNEQLGQLEASLNDGTFTGSKASLREFTDAAVLRGDMSREKQASLFQKYFTERKKQEDTTSLAAAAVRGDLRQILLSGKTEEDAMTAVKKLLASQQATTEQMIDVGLKMGMNGMSSGYKFAGSIADTAFTQMRNQKGEILTQHKAAVEHIVNTLRDAEARGDSFARTSMLSGVSEGNRAFVNRMLSYADKGHSYEEAHQLATQDAEMDDKLSPSAKAALAEGQQEAVKAAMESATSQNALQHLWLNVKALWSDEAAADMQMRPYSPFFGDQGKFWGDSPIVKEYTDQYRNALSLEISDVMNTYHMKSPKDAIELAKSNLAARTIQTEFGPMFAPKNFDIDATFGVTGANRGAAAQALADLAKVAHKGQGGSAMLYFKGNQVMVASVDKKGNRDTTHVQELPPADIRKRVQEITNAQDKYNEAVYGNGYTVSTPGGKVTFNGDNTAGAPNRWMFKLRASLVEQEGVSKTSYKDSHGQSVGVGIFHTNPYYPQNAKDGKPITDDDINVSFKRASDDVAKAAYDYMDAYNLPQTSNTFTLLGHLAYQSGLKFATFKDVHGGKGTGRWAAQRVLENLSRGNVDDAVEWFKLTAAWKFSPQKRRDMYLNLIQNYNRND